MTRSFRWKRAGICGVLAAAAIASACAGQRDWRAILERDARMPPERRRAQLHAALRGYREPHDTYIHLMPIADETSVPLLLERFRIDHPGAPPEPEPEPPPLPPDPFPYSVGRVSPVVSNRFLPGFSCVQSHLVDALANATNTDRGMYFPAWKTWWDENQHKPRREWIAQGFKDAGLSPSNPIDESFALDLIGLLPERRREYLAVNARRLLETVPAGQRLTWIEKAARSEQQARRLGAIAALRHLHPAGHEDLLRTLTADANADVRVQALNALNARVRQRPDREVRTARAAKTDTTLNDAPVAITDDLLVVARGGGIEAFDARSGQRRWRTPSIRAAELAIVNDRVVALTVHGQLVGFTPRGTIAWRVASDSGENDGYGHGVQRLMAIGGYLGVLQTKRLEWRALDTGRVVHAITGRISDADAEGSTVYALVNDQLQKMIDGQVIVRRDLSGGLGVSVRGDTVCVLRHVASGMTRSSEVACHDVASLALRWTRPTASSGTGGHGVAPVQSESHVYVPSDTRLTSFRRDDGAPGWADLAGQEVFGTLMVTPRGLLSAGPNYRLELRALDTGEVLEVWPDKARRPAVSPSGRTAAFAAGDGSPRWLSARQGR